MTANDLVFNAGIPTAPDVDKINIAWPELNEGDEITKQEISAVIGVAEESHRFHTVVNSWRRQVYRDRNIFIGAIRGAGFRVLTRRERCEAGGHKLKVGLRSTKRGGGLVASTDKTGLPEDVVRAADHVVRLSGMITTLAAAEAKRLRYPDPVLQLKEGK
jgi:hypothetical protein